MYRTYQFSRSSFYLSILLVLLFTSTPSAGVAQDGYSPHGGMMRYPAISAQNIVFMYANDLWVVDRMGGTARLLASPAGEERYPMFSPDGRTIAFGGNYDGNNDLYTVSVEGGLPFRVTHHPHTENLTSWSPDGRDLLFSIFGLGEHPRTRQLFRVSADGGLPVKLPVPYGEAAVISPDGEWLAYTPTNRDQRTWKRYRGGLASDIWLFNLKNNSSRQLTEWEGTDTRPMWQGGMLYYLSDRGAGARLNIWRVDPAQGNHVQVTNFTDYDVKFPSNGPGPDGKGEIIFQYGSELRVLDLGTEQVRSLDITIPGARPQLRTQTVDASKDITSRDISPSGKQVVLAARGDVWILPAQHGSPVDLTRSDSVAERSAVWSPDGASIAYASDLRGDSYDIYVRPARGGEQKRISDKRFGFVIGVYWSPDSKKIAVTNEAGEIYLVDVASAQTTEVERGLRNSGRVSWSHNSQWLTYIRDIHRSGSAVMLYDTKSKKAYQVTEGLYGDSWPTFDRKGEYLYFATQRDFSSPSYADYGNNFVYNATDVLVAVPLQKDGKSPLAPKFDREEVKDDAAGKDKKDDDKGEDKKDDKSSGEEDLKIDIEGFEQRAVLLPVDRGLFYGLSVNDKAELLYLRGDEDNSAGPTLMIFNPFDDKPEEQTVKAGVFSVSFSADGTKALVSSAGGMSIINTAAAQTGEAVSTSGMQMTIRPQAEWRQMYQESWRLYRDYFYDPGMHKVDWPGMRDHYAGMLPDVRSRDDLAYVISELMSELNVGHTYYFGQSADQASSMSVGMLGVDWELQDGAYRIKHVYQGAKWETDARSPLQHVDGEIGVGDYVLAVNNTPINAAMDPWAAFQGMGGATVELTVSSKPTIDKDARTVVVKLLNSEFNLRYRDWVETNRQYVAQKSNGKVAYIYVPDTGVNGQNELIRQYVAQWGTPALLIDDRWNGGGQIPDRFIELLNRPIRGYWATRHEGQGITPPDANSGPKAMLINGSAGSGGDAFPYMFRQAGLGKLIGMRTWGGLVGLSGNPQLIDGAGVTVPTFGFYEVDGTWGVEGHGVDPDIKVVDDPAKMLNGGDPQLDAAVDHLLNELRSNPSTLTPPPAYPDRSGMGILDKDK